MSLRSRLVTGALAGAAGTVTLDALWYQRYRRGGGDAPFPKWETQLSVDSWDAAPAPARVGRLAIEKLTGSSPDVSQAQAINNVMHWGYGLWWGVLYSLTGGARRPIVAGAAYGALIDAGDYVTLPLLGIYEAPWKYPPKTLWDDLSAHMLYGFATAVALGLLD
jgi:hypothetical protein